ncbi:P1 family peptidase [Mucisphaera sp.]|uniref:DmpA family aminopeptidase n=1 Tax=Mucisphaera sp. TaxID=2913024 RepID=UPI003D10FC82
MAAEQPQRSKEHRSLGEAGAHAEGRRARDLGLRIGVLNPGPLNAITDVEGVRVGHRTLIEGTDVRTGVTAILPHGGNVFRDKVPAAIVVGNGFGKFAGFTQVRELGTLETPIVLTNTLSVAAGIEGLIRHTLAQPGNERVLSVNAVVGETNDGYLNDIRGMHVTVDDVLRAIASADTGPVEEGSVGAGTGITLFGYKGGIGTASRVLSTEHGGYTIGVLVQANYGGELTIAGISMGELLLEEAETSADGSCVIVIATNAPLSARNLERLARRSFIGLGRTGSYLSNGSGDYAVAFSTGYIVREQGLLEEPVALVTNRRMSPLFQAVAEATEEAVLNALFMATTVTGRDGNTREAVPVERVLRAIKQR